MLVRLVLEDQSVVRADVDSLDVIHQPPPNKAAPEWINGTDERTGVLTVVNPRYVVRAYSIENPGVVVPG